MRIFVMRKKVKLALYKLRKYALHWWKRIQTNRIQYGKEKIRSWPRMKKMLAIKYYHLDCDELLLYTKQEYFWPRSSHLNYFEEPYIPPSREELYVEKHIFLEENIEIFEEISEDIVIEEESDIKNCGGD